MRSILANRGVDYEDHRKEVISDRASWLGTAFTEAIALQSQFTKYIPDDQIPLLARELAYGNATGGVNLQMSGVIGEQPQPAQPAGTANE